MDSLPILSNDLKSPHPLDWSHHLIQNTDFGAFDLQSASIHFSPILPTQVQQGVLPLDHQDQSDFSDGEVNGSSDTESKPAMESFPPEKVTDVKHVIYNLLVEHHNFPEGKNLIEPIELEVDGAIQSGFRFVESERPDRRLPEIYSQVVRKAQLHLQDPYSIFTQDLYRFYHRACLELLSKYFKKVDKYTYLYIDSPLFIPGLSLKEAEFRVRNMRTIARKRRK